jgi:hypothetical protein
MILDLQIGSVQDPRVNLLAILTHTGHQAFSKGPRLHRSFILDIILIEELMAK